MGILFMPATLLVAWLLAIFGVSPNGDPTDDFAVNAMRWMMYVPVGGMFLVSGVMHTVFAKSTAKNIGWTTKTDLRQWDTQRLVSSVEHLLDFSMRLVKRLTHSGELGTLTGKKIGDVVAHCVPFAVTFGEETVTRYQPSDNIKRAVTPIRP